MKRTRKQTAVKGGSRALLISIAIHVALFFIAGAFIAVEVSQRQEAKFEAKKITRPKMKLKKLQVPVKIEKRAKRQAPKLSKRVTAMTPKKTTSVDFKMPEMSGFGGGTANVSSSGFGGSLGFATTQLNVFGLKSQGEKILFLLDTDRNMLTDRLGGIPAYTLIKEELMTLIGNLPPTALFNVVVFERWNHRSFGEGLRPASAANIEALHAWLGPLNTQNKKIGLKTLGEGGCTLDFEQFDPFYQAQKGWMAGLSMGMAKGVDSVYWLGMREDIGHIGKATLAAARGTGGALTASTGTKTKGHYDIDGYGREKWELLVKEARRLHAEENARRAAEGLPMQVIPGQGKEHSLVHMIFPKKELPNYVVSGDARYTFAGSDIVGYINGLAGKYSTKNRRNITTGLRRKKSVNFNVIHFVPKGKDVKKLGRLAYVAEQFDGKYLQIKGMRALESASTVAE